MLVTALVQHNGNTLVVDLPRNRMDLETKLRSIGIKTYSDKIHVVDDEEVSDISVKLYGKRDIGHHLAVIFNENCTLCEANRVMTCIENADKDIIADLETKIVHDQYESPSELVADIKRMTDAVGRYTETFYFPLTGELQDDESFYSKTDNRYLRHFKYEIRELLEREQDMDGESMKDFFYDDDNVQKKMTSCKWDITERDGTLYGKVELRLKEQLTTEEKETVRKWIIGQNADGLGEGFEQRPIRTEDGDLYVSLWNSSDNYFVYDENEMDDYLSEQHGAVLLQ